MRKIKTATLEQSIKVMREQVSSLEINSQKIRQQSKI